MDVELWRLEVLHGFRRDLANCIQIQKQHSPDLNTGSRFDA